MEWIAVAAGAGAIGALVAFLVGYRCGLKTSVVAYRLANGQDPLKDPKPIDAKVEETG